MSKNKNLNYDCENMRYIMEFSLLPSIVFEKGPEFAMALCQTNGKILFDMMQDYYENIVSDIKRRNIRLFDPRRIKVNCVELENGWCVSCVSMPDDINGTSPIFCNAYYIAFKMKGKIEKEEKEEISIKETNEDTFDDGYDDGFIETDEEVILDNGKDFLVRFFTVEEATTKEEIISEPIYQGIEFGKRKLCEIFEDGKRKEYGETEKDMVVNLIKVAVLLGAIDKTTFQEDVVDTTTGEILEDFSYQEEIPFFSAEDENANKEKDIFDDLDEFDEL